MKKFTTGLIIAALGFSITLFFLRSERAASPTVVESTAQPVAQGQLQQLNEVKVQLPPAAAGASGTPTVAVIGRPGESVPIPLDREFEPLLKGGAGRLHELIEREPREEPWATSMEGKWNAAFAANPELLAYGTPTAHCRSTRCEIRLVTYRSSSLDKTGWAQLVIKGAGARAADDRSVPLVKGIRLFDWSSIQENGATVILYHYEYERDPPSGQSSP